MAAVSLPTATIARGAQLIGFAVVAVALAIVSWRETSLNLPNVGQFAGIIGSGFLGGIINPLMKSLSGGGSGGADQSSGPASASPSASANTAQVAQTVEAVQDKAAAELGTKTDFMWEAAVMIGAVAIVVAALALAVDGARHVNAAAVLTALATAFGALFVDTSKVTHNVGTANGTANGAAGSGS